jgi:hypothetical protein
MVGTWFGFGAIWSDFVYEMWMVVSIESPQKFQQTTELYNSKKNFKNAWAILVIVQFQIVILESKFHHSQIHSNHFY